MHQKLYIFINTLTFNKKKKTKQVDSVKLFKCIKFTALSTRIRCDTTQESHYIKSYYKHYIGTTRLH